MKKKILFLSNHFITLYSFRKELINKLVEDGHDVFLSLPEDKDNKYFKDLGCKIIITDIDNYLGSYFIGTNSAFKKYANDQVLQIYVMRQKDIDHNYSLAEFLIDLSCLVVGVFSAIPIFDSIKFHKIHPTPA